MKEVANIIDHWEKSQSALINLLSDLDVFFESEVEISHDDYKKVEHVDYNARQALELINVVMTKVEELSKSNPKKG